MTIRRSLLYIFALSCALGLRAEAPVDDDNSDVEVQGDSIQIDRETGEIVASNGVTIRYKNSSMTAILIAKRARVERNSGEAEAEGDVTIQMIEAVPGGVPKAELWRGERVRFNFRTKAIEAGDFRVGSPPLFISGAGMAGGRQLGAIQSITNAIITTDDLAEPALHIRAQHVRIVPGKFVEADGAKIFIGSTPILPLPHYYRRLDNHRLYWEFTPGFRSIFGPFLLSTYHWAPSTNLDVGMDLDARQRRGMAGGPNIAYDLGKWGQGGGRFYYTQDDLPSLLPDGSMASSSRWRYDFNHSLTNTSGFSFQSVVHSQKDALMIRDFFENEFRRDPQPKTFFEGNQAWRNVSLDVLVQPQLNDFFTTVERLPDVKLTGLRQQLGVSPLYYEGEASVSYLRFHDSSLGGTNFAALRADTYHQLLLPQTYFGWLNITPRVGGRFTHYGDPDGLTPIAEDRQRWVLNTGAEVSMKASRVWAGSTNRVLDISGLRHIFQPSINYVFVPEPDKRPFELPEIERDLPTFRLRPIEFPDYNTIDSIDSQNVLRFSLRNKIQTLRRGDVENVVHSAVYTDWRLDPLPGQTTFPDLFSDLDFAPRSWLQFGSQLRYDINGSRWSESFNRTTLRPNDTWAWTLGHRYLRDDPATYGVGNNLVYNSVFWKLNENWAFRASHHIETRDGRLEEQRYTVYRDLRSWTAALSVRLRDNRTLMDDWAIVMTFSLKAFPRFGLNGDNDRFERVLGL